MQILVNEHAGALLDDRVGRLGHDVELVRLTVDGRLLIDGRERTRADVAPEVAFATAHAFTDGSAPMWLALLDGLESLRWLQSPAAGHLEFYDALLARGVRITGAHVNAVPIAEYVMGAVLANAQRVDEWADARAERAWRPHQFSEIAGTTWLIVGVGAIGSAVAARAGAFGAHVIGARRHPTGTEPVHEMVDPAELQGVLGRGVLGQGVLGRIDVVVLAAPATPQTIGLVDEAFLAAMKPGSVLVNIARGALVDEAALLASLDRGHLGRAILDVFATEPLPADNPLWEHPGVVLTPHSSAGGTGRHARAAELFLDNLERFRAGRPLRHEFGSSDQPPSSVQPSSPQREAGAPAVTRFTVLAEIETEARRGLDADVWDFVDGGSGDESTLAANRSAFARITFRPRLLTGAPSPETTTSFLGVVTATPLLVAPFAGDSLLHADGYRAVISGAARVGTVAIVPEVTAEPLEVLARVDDRAGAIFQLSLRHPDERLIELLERIDHAGFSAVCVTADAPVVGVRRRDRRNRFDGAARLTLGNFPPVDGGAPALAGAGHTREPMSWARLGEVMATTRLPFAVKGVLSAPDARAALDIGAAGVYVSNHGGRQLDGAPATLDRLAEIVDEVGDVCDVALDGGVRSGADTVMALALGARVVLVGRPVAWGLAVAGTDGVARVLEILDHELRTTMALLGVADLASLDRSVLQSTPSFGPARTDGGFPR
jgi:4-hydroxymandelate oxidase